MIPSLRQPTFYASPSDLAFGEAGEVFQSVSVPRSGLAPRLPIAMITVHDGHRVPTCAEPFARGLDPEALEEDFLRERDWGADAIASTLAQLLGVRAYHRVSVARAFLDCGRRIGLSGPDDRGLDTKSVPHRIAGTVPTPEVQHGLLNERCEFGVGFGQLLERTLAQTGRRVLDSGALFLAIHTYDRFGDNGERAPVSLVYRPREGEEPPEHFIKEALRDTSDPGLIRGLEASFQAASIPLSHNDPYVLPMGGLEIPALHWMFERAQLESPEIPPCDPRRRPSVLVIEYRKDLLLDGFNTDAGWFHPVPGTWKRRAIRQLALATAAPILAHFREIDPLRFLSAAA